MFKPEHSVLMIIDVQGRLSSLMHEADDLIREINVMIKAAEILDMPIIWMEQYPKGLGYTIDAIKENLSQHKAIEKITFGGCGCDDVMKALKDTERNQVIVTGIEAHVCVYQTVLGLLEEGYQVSVNQDAVSSRKPSNKKLGLERMKDAGAVKTSTEMILFELMQTAEHPNFKQISNLLK